MNISLLIIFSIDTTCRNTVLLVGNKEAGTGGLLGAVLELFIPRSSHGVQETFLLQAQAASTSPYTLRTVMSDSLGLFLAVCPTGQNTPGRVLQWGTSMVFFPFSFHQTDPTPSNLPCGIHMDKTSSSIWSFKTQNLDGATGLMTTSVFQLQSIQVQLIANSLLSS